MSTLPGKRSQPSQRGLQVLVAEDNQVNQLVATRIFEKLGHQATVVSSGREAFVSFQTGKFDLIAMDVQMPEMDGLDATSAIRAWEKTAGTHTPIIAMTAHAMKGDRERCLAAGMDGYISKPIRIGELEHAIAQLISPPNSAKVPVSEADQADGAIDHTALLAGFNGNRRVLRKLVRLFLADCPRRLAEIKEAIRRGDAGALGRAAHALKGSVGNFAAKNAFAAAQRLEIMSRDIDLDNVGKACVTLESELAPLSEELRKLTMNSSIRKTKTDKRAILNPTVGPAEGITEVRRQEALLKTGALQNAILNSANFSSIATDEKGVIQIFNVGAERMLGYTVADVLNKITPADISDPQEVIARAKALSLELGTTIRPGFEALVFKASRGIEDIYELTYIRKDGSRFPAVVSVTALRDAQNAIIGYLLIGTDNTARKQAEEALLKAGALQSAIFNSANFSSIATDAKGVIQIFNVGAERMLGYAAADVMNKITPADISDPHELIARAKSLSVELGTQITPGFEALVFKASRGIEDIYELTYIRKDGSRFPAVVSVTALRDAQDDIIGYLLIGTELKAGALQSAIFNSANFSSIATDAKGVIQIFNVGAERMLGYTAAEVMNKITPADISDPQEVIARAKSLSAELSTPITPGFEALVFKASRGIEDIYELTYIRKDGSRFPAVVSVTALRNAQNAIIGYLLIGTDNTARKRVEEEQKKLDQRLRDQQFYTRSLIESNIDAIMTTDPAGIITDVNKQMEALTGCTRDELIGAPFKNYFTDPERAEAGIKLVLAEKKVTDYELTASARDGKKTVVSYNATTFYDRDRKLQGVFAAARDVTERKRFEVELQETNVELETAKSAAEKANLAKSDFLSSMSHELRSPLNAILGFAQLLESTSPLPTASQRENIGQILTAGWHLLKLINEILDLAVVESGKMLLSPELVSLAEVISECQAMMEPQAKQRGINMTFPQLDIPYYIHADRTRVKQVLINLLSNAIKYNREQGTVEVKCTATSPERIRISVKDTGAGLAPGKLTQLFQPFNRLGQESRAEEGTGIGLVMSKRVVELMEGAIGVESSVGVGSVFWIELRLTTAPPLAVASPEFTAAIQARIPTTTRLRTLLYVEDNPANLTLVEQLVARRSDIRLLTAVNGTLGIEIARASQPEVILMDINLPGISGIDALKILREDPATAHIPVVALSANAMQRDTKKGMEAGFFYYLTKPIKVNEFMDALDGALEFAEKNSACN
jgi:PAS domain S-box-containing protein